MPPQNPIAPTSTSTPNFHLHLRPATPLDAPTLTQIYMSSFQDDAISLCCFPSRTPGSPSWVWWNQLILSEMGLQGSEFICVFVVENGENEGEGEEKEGENEGEKEGENGEEREEEKIIGWAKWNTPIAVIPSSSSSPSPSLSQPAPPNPNPNPSPTTPPSDTHHPLFSTFFHTLDTKRLEIMQDNQNPNRQKPYYHLEMLCVLPEYQGRGAAGMMIRWGLALADGEGREVYLDASPVGRGIYEGLGFGERGRFGTLVEMGGDGEKEGEGREKEIEGEEGNKEKKTEEYVEVMMVRPARGVEVREGGRGDTKRM